MSSSFDIEVEVCDFNPKRRRKIVKALQALWGFGGEQRPKTARGDPSWPIYLEGEDAISGFGASIEDFIGELAVAVWVANGGFCPVVVRHLYMDALPWETEAFEGRKDFERMREAYERRRDSVREGDLCRDGRGYE
jgi:hypothetical protein